jgi:D-aminopeptidase
MQRTLAAAIAALVAAFDGTLESQQEGRISSVLRSDTGITNVPGIKVGHFTLTERLTGCTVILAEYGAVGGVDVRGSAPGTVETDLLDPVNLVPHVHAVFLSGGSAFGLEVGTGVRKYLYERKIGFPTRVAKVPIVPGAILFDLLNGGDKDWGQYPPYRELGYSAARGAGVEFALGSAGAGLGATTANLKGGVGSASAITAGGIAVGAVAVVNAAGTAVIGDGPHFWAAPFERDGEFGGRGLPAKVNGGDIAIRAKGAPAGMPGENTTLAVIATDARLTKAQCHRLAVMAADGYARALYPVHSPLDGDIIFAASIGDKPLTDPHYALAELGLHAGNVMARAVARGVYEASALPFAGALPAWKDRFGRD